MSIKQKLLEALDIAFGDLSEERLIDILLDAYKATRQRNLALQVENSAERETLLKAIENMKAEQHKMRSDPLYMAHGEYYFTCNNRKFCVHVQGNHLLMFERQAKIDYAAQQFSRSEWEQQWP